MNSLVQLRRLVPLDICPTQTLYCLQSEKVHFMSNMTGKLFYVESDDCIYMHVTKISVTYRHTHSHTEMHTHICIYYDDDNEPCGLI